MLTSGSRYARTDFNLDTRIRKRYIPLLNQQRRLRHLTGIAARNITSKSSTIPEASYFTLHQSPSAAAFFTSEMDSEYTNPTWRSFEPSGFSDEINTASCYVVVRVWQMLKSDEKPCSRIEWIVHFSGLVYLGEQIPKEGKKFKPDTLLFGTSEGYYGSPDCCLGLLHEYSVKDSILVDTANIRVSYSVNTVSRIQTIQRAIRQTQASVQRTRSSIQERLMGTCSRQEQLAERERLTLQASILKQELDGQRLRLEQSSQAREQAKQKLQLNRTEYDECLAQLQYQKDVLLEKRRFYYETRETYLKTAAQLALQRKQHISDLSCIYPILKYPEKMGYSICGAHLPQSEDLAGQDDTMISVALGYVTHLLLMISYFLNLPLRYPLRHFGSKSSVWDLVIDRLADKEKEFPLFSRGKDRMHFLYAVYLLNKNIAQLRHMYGLSTQDLRLTLANVYSFIDLRFNIKSDPYGSLQISMPLPAVNNNHHHPPSLSAVLINSDPLLAINGSLELKNHQDMVAHLTREIQCMTPGTPAKGQPNSVALNSSSQMSCSLDKGLNEIQKLQKKLYPDECKPKANPLPAFQQHIHASFPNLSSMVEERIPSSPLQCSPAVEALRESFKMCTAESAENSDDDLLIDHTMTSNVGLVLKIAPSDTAGSF